MLEYLRGTADAAHRIATGTLERPVVPLSEQDSLGCSLSLIAERIDRWRWRTDGSRWPTRRRAIWIR